MATDLEESIASDHLQRSFDPNNRADLLTLARSGRSLGLEHEARAYLQRICPWLDRRQTTLYSGLRKCLERPRRRSTITDEELASWIRHKASRHPERFAAFVRDCLEIEKALLRRQVKQLKCCGIPWGRIVRLFWKRADGSESSRTYGLHACKSRFCPKCGRRKAFLRAESIEKVMELAREWEIGPEHVRFLTLTIPNGKDIPTLHRQAHRAWAKLQRTRWWPRWVLGWFRATECVVGQDGDWNLHLHVVLLLWSHRISYSQLWNEWEILVGCRSQIDIDRLHTMKFRDARRKGGIAAAARYVSKYISKADLKNIRGGPGGLAHYVNSMRRVRAFSMGGGAAVLRRFSAVLLPNWTIRLESLEEDAYLRDGMPAYRQEEIDPQTGESIEVPIMSPAMDDQARREAHALALPLLQMGGTIGVPCGPRKRWRRIGSLPAPSRCIRVKEYEKWHRTGDLRQSSTSPIQGIRSLIAGGDWRIYTVSDGELPVGRSALAEASQSHPQEMIPNSGTERKRQTQARAFRVVLPGKRYAWRDASEGLWKQFQQDQSIWGQRRKAAHQAWAREHIGDLTRRDSAGLILSGCIKAQSEARSQAWVINQALDGLRRSEIVDAEQVTRLQTIRNDLIDSLPC